MLSILKYILLLPPTSSGPLKFPPTSHSISLPTPPQSPSVSFTCSLSCYVLPTLWGWQSHIRHVIKREMWNSSRGKLGAIEWCCWPFSPPHRPAVTLASSPFCTQDLSSLQWAVSGVTAHEPHCTPTPRHAAHLREVSLQRTRSPSQSTAHCQDTVWTYSKIFRRHRKWNKEFKGAK